MPHSATMRILLSAYACAPNRGSEPGYGWRCAEHLATRGHDVTVLTRRDWRASIETYMADRPLGGPRVVYLDVSLPRRLVPYDSGQHYTAWQFVALRAARRLHTAQPFDVVHHVTWGSVHLGSMLWRLPPPFVYGPVGGGQTPRREFAEIFGRAWPKELVRTAGTQVLRWWPPARGAAAGARIAVAANSETARVLRRLGADEVDLACDSALPERALASGPAGNPGSDPGVLEVLWVGRLLPRKAPLLAVRAIAAAPHGIRMSILGEGPEDDRVRAEVARLGLGDRVRLEGLLPWADVQRRYRQADVLLFTSLRDSFGGQLLEAMAAGLPLVVLDHQGAHDHVPGDAAIKVPAHNPAQVVQGLAKALTALSEDPSRRHEMGAAALTAARELTWETTVARWEDIYMRSVHPAPGIARRAGVLDDHWLKGDESTAAEAGSTLIVCTRNRPDDLRLCLEAVRESTLLPHVIVVDGSDDDGSLAISRVAAAEWPGSALRHLRTEAGLARQRNTGVDHVPTASSIVHFIDDDTEVEPDYFATIMRTFADDPAVAGVGGLQTNARPMQVKPLRRFFLLQGPDAAVVLSSGRNSYPWGASTVTDAEWLVGACMSYRLGVFSEELFDGRLEGYSWGEDYDFSYRVSRRHRLVLNPSARLVHHFSETARARARSLAQARVHVIHAWVREQRHHGLSLPAYWWSVLGEVVVLLIKAAGLRDATFVLEALGTVEGATQVLRHGSDRSRRP